MQDILVKKIISYVKRKHPESTESRHLPSRDYNKILDLLFTSPITWRDNKEARLFEAISAFSNRRPRWMVQLCRMAAAKARESKKRKIDLEHINYVLEDFGKKRRDDLIKEHKHQFVELENLIDAFRATEKEFRYADIHSMLEEKFIRDRASSEIPPIDGSKYVNPEDLGHFVYKLGLISRVHSDAIKFTHFSDDPDLYRSGENRGGNIVWSIHPSYRTFLNIR